MLGKRLERERGMSRSITRRRSSLPWTDGVYAGIEDEKSQSEGFGFVGGKRGYVRYVVRNEFECQLGREVVH